MGMDAELLATGPFRYHLAKHLEYPFLHYKGIPEEAPIITLVLTCATTESSYYLAEVLKVEAWALGNHRVNPEVILENIEDMKDYFHESFSEEVDNAIALAKAGFIFWYRPCG